jgi:hypothetical protein
MDRNVAAQSVGLEGRVKRNEVFRLPERRLSENYDGPASREESIEVSARILSPRVAAATPCLTKGEF